MSDWSIDSWRNKPILQQPTYDDAAEVADVEAKLASYPPLVFAAETRDLLGQLANVSQGMDFYYKGEIAQNHSQNLMPLKSAIHLK